ncbi:hypothetical protein ACQKGA_26445, partial [Priestia megaterium]|uniref:hypothetical protein n=1 Tax=Priestia megaterium TaxID=1404 RepID=UPI003D04EA7E
SQLDFISLVFSNPNLTVTYYRFTVRFHLFSLLKNFVIMNYDFELPILSKIAKEPVNLTKNPLLNLSKFDVSSVIITTNLLLL